MFENRSFLNAGFFCTNMARNSMDRILGFGKPLFFYEKKRHLGEKKTPYWRNRVMEVRILPGSLWKGSVSCVYQYPV